MLLDPEQTVFGWKSASEVEIAPQVMRVVQQQQHPDGSVFSKLGPGYVNSTNNLSPEVGLWGVSQGCYACTQALWFGDVMNGDSTECLPWK